MHLRRSLAGVIALCLWFYAIGKLPLATAMTLNYTSSVWMAMFLLGATLLLGRARVDRRLLLTVLLGFVGVALILRPTIAQNQLWYGLIGLVSGMISAAAYLQVTALGRAGEPDYRIVFYFSLGGILAGVLLSFVLGWHAHRSLHGVGLLLAVGVLATVAQLLMTRAYAIGRPLVNASLQYLGIAFSFLFGVMLFDDRITWMAVAGMFLIVAAGIGATGFRARGIVEPDTSIKETSG
jgi:S-adenosylmethionine uptake transporter